MSLFRVIRNMREQFWAEIFSLGSDEDYDTQMDSTEDPKSVPKKTSPPHTRKDPQTDTKHPVANTDNPPQLRRSRVPPPNMSATAE
ncbi:hypothetical protein ACHAP5_012084 [Fusarium lateritium]